MKKLCHTLSLGIMLMLTNCTALAHTQYGNGQAETRSFALKDFTKVALAGDMRVTFTQGSDYRVAITLDSNLFSCIDVYIEGETLFIQPKKHSNLWAHHHDVAITMPQLHKLDTAGKVNATIEQFNQPDAALKISLAGADRVNAHVITKDLSVSLSGACRIDLKGHAENFTCSTAGSGSIYASECKSENVNASVAGVGTIEVYPVQSLRAEVAGLGAIWYRGDPPIKKTSVAGLGFIKRW
ncbi:MAG: head GIN domain-containing protein [Treponema sp.]